MAKAVDRFMKFVLSEIERKSAHHSNKKWMFLNGF